jgi:hypothetical protein
VLPFTNPLGQVKTSVRRDQTLMTKNKKCTSTGRKRGADQLSVNSKRWKGNTVFTVWRMKQWSLVTYV